MPAYRMRCTVCQHDAHWIACPTGGWWAHAVHPADGHDVHTGFDPREEIDDNGNWVTQ
jgi:hypothetical protein